MSHSEPLRCQRCGKPIGYVSITAKNVLAAKPSADNVKLVATCKDCKGGNGFSAETFNMNQTYRQ